MAEVDFDSEFLLQPLVLQEQDVVVEGDGLDLREPFFHLQKRTLDVAHRHRQDSLKQRLPHSPVREREQYSFAALARHDEVSFHMSEPLSFVDMPGSFGNHAFAVEDGFSPAAASLPAEYCSSVRLDLPAVHATNVAAYGPRRSCPDIFFNLCEPASQGIRRLVVHEVRLHEVAQRPALRDFLPFLSAVAHSYVRDVFGVDGIVSAAAPSLF